MVRILFLILSIITSVIAVQHKKNVVGASNHTRCRTHSDFQRIPWLLESSTFHHLGYPLIKSLCSHKNHFTAALDCATVSSHQWPNSSHKSSRSSIQSSTILIDPPLTDDGGESSGVFVMNAIFAIFHELGYKVAVRHWSPNLNPQFPEATANFATNVSEQWDNFIAKKRGNPFIKLRNYISFQCEVGIAFYMHGNAMVNTSPFSRVFKWIIGYHQRNTFKHYEHNAMEMHCLGANHQLGEGLFCSSSGVIACPMFAFHHQQALRVTPETRRTLKENVVLIDSDAHPEIDSVRLAKDLQALGLSDVQVLVHRNRKRHDIPDLYAKTKISLDCRNPGVEFINYEATLYDVMTLSCDSRATSNVFDFPIPSQYRLEPSNWPKLVAQVHDLLVHYEERLPDFKVFKELSRNSHKMIANQLDVNFFSRDVLFRTLCTTYSECRRTIPWALSLWILYPVARLEVFVQIPLEQYTFDNDVALEILKRTFNDKFFKVIHFDAAKDSVRHPASLMPSSPCTHLVYMDASFVPFGRDFLSTHIQALDVEGAKPITYWNGNRLVLSVTKCEDFWLVLQVVAGKNSVSWFFEFNGVARPIDEFDTLKAMDRAGVPRQVTSPEYLEMLTVTTPDMTKKEFEELVKGRATTFHAPGKDEPATVPPHLVLDMLLIPEIPSVLATSQALHTALTDQAGVEYSEGLYVPQLWLTSSSPRLPLSTLHNTFSRGMMEDLVTHLDPILQSSLIQRVLGVIPVDISRVFKSFDATFYPHVVSLIDGKDKNWGGDC